MPTYKYQSVSTSLLWERSVVLTMGSDLYEAVSKITKRGTEFRSIAADIANSLVLLSDLCNSIGELYTLDPFTCEADQYDLSLSLLGVCMCFNRMQIWVRDSADHGDKIQALIELQVLLICVQSALREVKIFRKLFR